MVGQELHFRRYGFRFIVVVALMVAGTVGSVAVQDVRAECAPFEESGSGTFGPISTVQVPGTSPAVGEGTPFNACGSDNDDGGGDGYEDCPGDDCDPWSWY